MQITQAWAAGLDSPEHRLLWYAGDRQAAVLVHGYPGTPLEMRGIAEALHRAGWTVRAPLLPGFGPELGTLTHRTRADWVEAVRREWRWLSEFHEPVLLVGYSMGAAIALQVAAEERVPALALIAPMQQAKGPLFNWLWPVLRRVTRQVRPFRHLPIDFYDPHTRENMARYVPGLDLDDPAVRAAIRDFAVPTRLIDELVMLGREAYERAPYYLNPTLVVHARSDRVISRESTLKLVGRLSGPVRYVEVEGNHDVVTPGHPGWVEVEQALQRFAWDTWQPRSGRPLSGVC
jgi:carboxylesterase